MYSEEEEDGISCNPCSSARLIGAPISDGVTIPTPVFVGIAVFFATLFLAPAILATTKGGRDMLEQAAKRKFAVG